MRKKKQCIIIMRCRSCKILLTESTKQPRPPPPNKIALLITTARIHTRARTYIEKARDIRAGLRAHRATTDFHFHDLWQNLTMPWPAFPRWQLRWLSQATSFCQQSQRVVLIENKAPRKSEQKRKSRLTKFLSSSLIQTRRRRTSVASAAPAGVSRFNAHSCLCFVRQCNYGRRHRRRHRRLGFFVCSRVLF